MKTSSYSFSIGNKTQKIEMAIKAIELSDKGFDVWHAVNPVCVQPTSNKRGDELAVSYQTAIVVDIDIQSDAHKSDNLAVDFDEAKSFLPFTPSLIIHSGYGLHAYYIFDTPIKITNENREELKRRNNLLLEVIRLRANGKKIDGVGDLPRVLRTPCTFNYKLGKDNAPLCHIVEDSGLRFSPNQIDEKLNALIIANTTTESQSKPVLKNNIDYFDDNHDLKEFRIRRMLDYINVVDGEYDKWLDVGFALFNEGMDVVFGNNGAALNPISRKANVKANGTVFITAPMAFLSPLCITGLPKAGMTKPKQGENGKIICKEPPKVLEYVLTDIH